MRPESFRIYPPLEGRFVRLVPLDLGHRDPLVEAARDPEVRRYILSAPGTTSEEMASHIRILLDRKAEGTDLPFTTVRVSDSKPVGMTRYLNIDRPNDTVEVGGTWLDRRLWRTPFNTESKYLLLTHAFETEGAHRVYLKTDVRNERSQRAIERIGAVREALLREHLLLPSGRYRSSVFFSILASEWPQVKRRLEEQLARPWVPRAPEEIASREGPGVRPDEGTPARPVPPPRFRAPVTLTGRFVELFPLRAEQIPELARAGRDPEIWRLLRIGPGRDEKEMGTLVEGMLADQAHGSVLPFAVLRLPERIVSGMFRYFDIDRTNRGVEVGTWLDPAVWRTPVNTEVKYLGLRYAFEQEGVHRVQLRTDSRNVRSQRAIERLGAIREGAFREHVRLHDGSMRTSFVYSILESEWPDVRRHLEQRLERPWDRAPPSGAPASVAR